MFEGFSGEGESTAVESVIIGAECALSLRYVVVEVYRSGVDLFFVAVFILSGFIRIDYSNFERAVAGVRQLTIQCGLYLWQENLGFAFEIDTDV